MSWHRQGLGVLSCLQGLPSGKHFVVVQKSASVLEPKEANVHPALDQPLYQLLLLLHAVLQEGAEKPWMWGLQRCAYDPVSQCTQAKGSIWVKTVGMH
jgi:hypothetical protein